MLPLEQRKRDPFFTEDCYTMRLELLEEVIANPYYSEDRELIKANFNDLDVRGLSFARVRYHIEDAWMHYSAGDPLDDIRARVLYAFEDLQRHQAAFPEHYLKLWEADTYYFTMLLSSWAVLFNLPQGLDILAAFISKDPGDGHDPFIHALFTSLGVKGFPGQGAELLHPDPYGIIYTSLTDDRAAQQASMSKYLKRWYKSKAVKGCYWHNNHTLIHHPENHLGYWAFETGMLTVLNHLDDSAYRQLNFYPRDLVDYSKEKGLHAAFFEQLAAKKAHAANAGE